MFFTQNKIQNVQATRKLIAGCFLLVCSLLNTYANDISQESVVDSMENKLNATEGIEQIKLLNSLSSKYCRDNPEKAKEYAVHAFNRSEKLQYIEGKASALNNLGRISHQNGEYDNAIDYYLQALKTFEELGDVNFQAIVFANIGTVYQSKKIKEKALEYAGLSLNLYEKLGDKKGIAMVFNNIANVYYLEKDFTKTAEYYTKALKVFEELDFKQGIAVTENNLGSVLMEQMNLEEALVHYNRSYKVHESLKDRDGIATCVLNIGTIFSKQGKHTEANEYLFRSLQIAREIGLNETVLYAYEAIADASVLAKNFPQAYEFQKKYSLLRDSLFSDETNRVTTEMMTKYETGKKENTIKIQNATLERQAILRNSIIAGLILVMIFAGIVFRNYKHKQKINQVLAATNTELNVTLVNLKSAQANLVQSEKMTSLGQLTAGVAHEINNPITFIQSSLTPLKRDIQDVMDVLNKYEELLPEDKKEQAEKFKNEIGLAESVKEISTLIKSIEEGTARTTDIVQGLQSFSRLDENEFKKADINQGINSTVLLVQSRTNAKNITITKRLDNLPEVECFPGKINQVFMNIIINAIEAIGNKKGGEIKIQTSADDLEIFVSIKDNGSGMTDEVRKKIFDPFFTTKDVGKGPGLGLSIAYGIIENHKGSIEAKSELGIGTEIIIKFPIQGRLA